MSDCDGTLKNQSFQHKPLLKKVKFGYSWCSKCPPRSRTHDRRRGRRCFMARSMMTWSRKLPLLNQTCPQVIDVTNTGTINTLLQYTPDLIVNWIKVRTVGWPQLR